VLIQIENLDAEAGHFISHLIDDQKNLYAGAALIGDKNLNIDLRHPLIIFHNLRSKSDVSIELKICNKTEVVKKCREGDIQREMKKFCFGKKSTPKCVIPM
jgi:hypothetical protein